LEIASLELTLYIGQLLDLSRSKDPEESSILCQVLLRLQSSNTLEKEPILERIIKVNKEILLALIV
jgi:hypothetical protein